MPNPQLPTSAAGGEPQRASRLPWELGLLVLLTVLIYGSRLTTLPPRGEESRRARIAVEMAESGDWVVPRQQGEPMLSRPPLQNWLIAGLGWLRGGVDVLSIRLPCVLAVLLTALLIYAYSRSFLSSVGAFCAAAAFVTAGQVMQIGRLGETDALFTLFVSGSLLIWHLGCCGGWPAIATWTAAYALVALGMLTKGLQAPMYFAGSVGVFLLLTRRWRELLTPAHAAGIAVFLLIWGPWQWAFWRALGWEGVRGIYGGDVALRFADMRWTTAVGHLFSYPAELLGACLLPWSVLLIVYFNRDFRKAIGPAREHVLFLAVCLAVTFPTVWLPPLSRARYYMPLYPCFAPLVGLAIERGWQAAATATYRPVWRYFSNFLAAGMVVTAVAMLILKWQGLPPSIGSQSWSLVLLFSAGAGFLAVVVLWAKRRQTPRRVFWGAVAVTAFAGLIWDIPVLNAELAVSEVSTAAEVAAVHRRLPADVRLVSLGTVDHLFAYYYGDPIELAPWPTADSPPPDYEYFCCSTRFSGCPRPEELPFPFETLATISCERRHVEPPGRIVIVGRRLPVAVSVANRAQPAQR